MVLVRRTSSIGDSMLNDTLWLFAEPTWTQGFLSVRTVRSGDIRHLVVALTSPGMPSAMKLMILNTTERKHGTVWKTRNWIVQLPMLVSHVLMSSNMWIARETTKWIAIVVHIGVTISIKIGTVRNDRNSYESRVQ